MKSGDNCYWLNRGICTFSFTISAAIPTLQQYAITDFLEDGCYDNHLRSVLRE
jgi:hypothetical protein